ncbi:MAG: hypothetical protein ACR2IF_08930 [Terriglobales bacterium]
MDWQIRIRAREALFAALEGTPQSPDLLLRTAREMREASAAAGSPATKATTTYDLYARLLECTARLTSWSIAVRSCEADADRYLRGARVLAQDTRKTFPMELKHPIAACFALIEVASDVCDVPAVNRAALAIPLPISYPSAKPSRPLVPVECEKPKEQPVVVAFTSFAVNGQPFQKGHLLNLDIGYDLTVEIRLFAWSDGEDELRLEPLSVEPSDSYELPVFSFTRPSGGGPFFLKARKRMVLKRATSFLARPLEFSYRARFTSAREVNTEGQRHLSVRCFDPRRDPQSGYEQVDLKLVEVRDLARKASGVNDSELNNFLVLMGAVGGIAGQAFQDNLFPGTWSEQEFQSELKRLLRLRPTIGSELEEHPHVSGGITDLSFRHVRLELKVIKDHYVTRDDLLIFLPQITQYVAGSDKRFGVLCVLDSSEKQGLPSSVADDISYEVTTGPSGRGLPIGIGAVIIRGHLAQPSSL